MQVVKEPWKALQSSMAENVKLIVTENTRGSQSKKVQDLLRPMLRYKIDSREALAARWKKNPRFLLAETSTMLRNGKQLLHDAWPKMVAKVIQSSS